MLRALDTPCTLLRYYISYTSHYILCPTHTFTPLSLTITPTSPHYPSDILSLSPTPSHNRPSLSLSTLLLLSFLLPLTIPPTSLDYPSLSLSLLPLPCSSHCSTPLTSHPFYILLSFCHLSLQSFLHYFSQSMTMTMTMK